MEEEGIMEIYKIIGTQKEDWEKEQEKEGARWEKREDKKKI